MAEIGAEELSQLEYLSLVSKVCTELDNHLGLSDKDLGVYFMAEDCGPNQKTQANLLAYANYPLLANDNVICQHCKIAYFPDKRSTLCTFSVYFNSIVSHV